MSDGLFLLERYWPDVDLAQLDHEAAALVDAVRMADLVCRELLILGRDHAVFLIVSGESEEVVRSRLNAAGVSLDRLGPVEQRAPID